MRLVNLSKKYNDRFIFENVNYKFSEGHVYWLQGKNGVGKSTLIRVLTGQEECDVGHIEGIPDKSLYIPEIPLTEDWLTTEENIVFLYKIAKLVYPQDIQWEKTLSIKEEDLKALSRDCSLGTNMKVSFSLIFSDTKISQIIIDEAFSHLDNDIQKQMLEYLLRYVHDHNAFVVFTHHDLINLNEIDGKITEIILTSEGIYEK